MAISSLFPSLWSARITYFATQWSAFLPNATRAWEGEAVYGNIVKVPTVVDTVTLSAYSRTADLTAPEVIDASTQDLSINQEKSFNFYLEDLDARQSRIPGASLINIKATGAGKAIANAIDDYVLGQLFAITDAKIGKLSARAAWNADAIPEIKKIATTKGMSWRDLVLVSTPEFAEGVEKSVLDKTYGDSLTGAPVFGNQAMAMDPTKTGGYTMTLGDMPFYVSNNLKLRRKGAALASATAADRGDTSYMFVFNRNDLALVSQVNKVETYRMEKRFATGVKGLVNYGAKVLDPGRVFEYRFTDVT